MSGEPATRYLGMRPDEMAEAFAAWAAGEGILARATGEQCADLARAFMAGCVYAARLAGDDPITAQPDYYTVAEVAEKLRIDIRTVYELIASGQLRSVRITRASGRRGTIRIPQDYLDEYIGRIRQ